MNPLIESLPLPQRLALAHAPGRWRDETLGLLALDAHLANLIRGAREPMLAQMRLAWWRERLEEAPDERPAGDPLLNLLDRWSGYEAALIALVDGWEHLLSQGLDHVAIENFAAGRAAGFSGLARLAAGADAEAAAVAGKRWALADLAAHLGQAEERRRALDAARSLASRQAALPRALRALTVLDGLARRAIARGGAPLADGPGAGLLALRLGIVGR